MPRLQYSKKRYSLTIPVELVDKKGWESGQRLLLAFNASGNIELSELPEKREMEK